MSAKKRPDYGARDFRPNEWYQTDSKDDLYRYQFRSAGSYVVIRYSDGSEVFHGSMNECRNYLNRWCYSHTEFIQKVVR